MGASEKFRLKVNWQIHFDWNFNFSYVNDTHDHNTRQKNNIRILPETLTNINANEINKFNILSCSVFRIFFYKLVFSVQHVSIEAVMKYKHE